MVSDIYISQSSFVVRTPKNQAALSGVGALLQSSGFARAQDDTYTVQEFMRSRSTLELLEKISLSASFMRIKVIYSAVLIL